MGIPKRTQQQSKLCHHCEATCVTRASMLTRMTPRLPHGKNQWRVIDTKGCVVIRRADRLRFCRLKHQSDSFTGRDTFLPHGLGLLAVARFRHSSDAAPWPAERVRRAVRAQSATDNEMPADLLPRCRRDRARTKQNHATVLNTSNCIDTS